MRRAEIRDHAERFLARMGLDSFVWAGPGLILNVEGRMIRFEMKSGISRKLFDFHMGRIAGIAEFTGAMARANAARQSRNTRHTVSSAITAG